MIVSRLSDGRILRLDGENWEIFDGSAWIPAEGVSGIEVYESIPLTEAETAKLISEGIPQPTKTSRKSQAAFSNSERKPPPGSGFRDVQEFNRYLLRGLDKR